MRYEYKVVPAPARGEKAKGVKAPEARFALTVEQVLNEMGADGWEFQRAETLPSEERQGLTGSASHWRHLLVFRRPLAREEPVALLEGPARPGAEPSPPSARPGTAGPGPAGLGAAGLVAARRPAETQAPMILTSPTTRAPATAEPATEKADPGETPKADATVREDQAAAETGATEAETVPDADWHPPKPTPSPSASADPDDNGVEETQDVDKPIGFLAARAARATSDKP
ncbi:DUF4177 domain-containing protein [Thalassococcus profundi]